VLGVEAFSDIAVIKARYRALVRELHPDVNPDPVSSARFLEVTESYQVLTDSDRRKHFDALLRMQLTVKEPPERTVTQTTHPKRTPARPSKHLEEEIASVRRLFASGRLRDAEEAGTRLRERNPRLGPVYALLGDIYQSQQKLDKAGKMYAFAVQFSPTETRFQKRYEEILHRAEAQSKLRPVRRITNRQFAFGLSLLVHSLLLAYVAVSPEAPAIALRDTFLSFWTPGLFLMLLLDGLICGLLLSASGQLDRWESLGGRLAYPVVGAISFWAALVLYGVTGLLQDAFTSSLSKVFAWCVVLTLGFAIAFSVQHTHGWNQVLMWGGNVIFLGTLAGWRLMDAFKS